MIEFSKRFQHLHYKLNLTKEFRKDVEWWIDYLPEWNGIHMIPHHREDHHLYTDASDLAYAGYFEGQWFAHPYTAQEKLLGRSINWREMEAVVAAAATWGNQWSNKRVIFHCDSDCIVHVLNSGTCKDPANMELV